MKLTSTIAALLLVAAIIMISFEVNLPVKADVGKGVLSIAFDDGRQSQYDYAYPLLQQYGIHATFYVISSYISDFSGYTSYMSISELENLQANGNEIGSHSVDHPNFLSLTDDQIVSECVNSKQLLQSYGFSANNFAYPDGATNDHINSIVTQYYRSARSAYTGPYIMSLPTSLSVLPAYPGESGDPSTWSQFNAMESAESMVDQIVSSNSYGIIFFHNIIPGDTTDAYTISQEYFQDFLQYVANSGVTTLTVNQALDIAGPALSASISPSSMSLTVGQSQLFSSTVTGGVSPYSYQWNLNGTAISGAHSSTYNFVGSTAGTYNINVNVVDNYVGNVQSNSVKVVVKAPPTVTISPTTARLTLGQSQTFSSLVVNGFAPFGYQWYLNGSAVSGGTSSSWIFTPAQLGHYVVKLNVTDNLGNQAQSNSVNDIIVNSSQTVTVTPANANMTLGRSQVLSSTVTGGFVPYTYQWYQNNTAITNATNPTYTFTPNTVGTYKINANVTDPYTHTAQSNNATLIVETNTTVTISPTQVAMYLGQSQKFTSSVSGGTTPYAYQWYLNDTAVTGATSSNWTFTPASAASYKVYLNITDKLNIISQSNIVTNITAYGPLSVTIAPAVVNMTVGAPQTFTSNVSGGDAPYTYQWYLNGTQIPTATGSTWTFNPSVTGTCIILLEIGDNYNATAASNNAVATIKPSFNLTVGVSGNGLTNKTGTTPYSPYTNVSVLATPNIGYQLTNWLLNGTNVGSTNPYVLNMTTNYNLTAVFAPSPFVPTSGWTADSDSSLTNAPYVLTSTTSSLSLQLDATSTSSRVTIHSLNVPASNLSNFNHISVSVTGTSNALIDMRFFLDNGTGFDVVWWANPTTLNTINFDLTPYAGRTLTIAYVALMSSDGQPSNITVTAITFVP